MNKKLDTILSEEISRFNDILSYTLTEGHHYKFYEAEEEVGTEDVIDEPGEMPVDDTEEVIDDTDLETGDEVSDETGVDTTEMEPEPIEDEGDIEVDVTDLVNSTKEMNIKADDIVQKIVGTTTKIEDMINKVDGVEKSLQKMDSLVQQMQSLTKQVELMRPPTESERRKALAKDSYPFNVTQDDYAEGTGPKTQTDLEGRPDKLSMMDNLVNDYNETDIKHSFYNVEDKEERKISNY